GRGHRLGGNRPGARAVGSRPSPQGRGREGLREGRTRHRLRAAERALPTADIVSDRTRREPRRGRYRSGERAGGSRALAARAELLGAPSPPVAAVRESRGTGARVGVGPADEVIVPAYTWNATPNAVIAAGATPVLAEIDESLTLDPADVERRITARTRAILPVHMRGAPADMRALTELARERGLIVVEDVCQSAGASFEGRLLGTFGDAGAFSLQFNKIITTGEGGVLITDRDDLYDLAIDVHDCAAPVRRGEGLPRFPGWNFRASELTG